MAGSDRDPDPNDSKRAQVGKHKPSTRAKWRSSMSTCRSVLENVLDTADIVRDRDLFCRPRSFQVASTATCRFFFPNSFNIMGYKEDLSRLHAKFDQKFADLANDLRKTGHPWFLSPGFIALTAALAVVVAVFAWIQPQISSHLTEDAGRDLKNEVSE